MSDRLNKKNQFEKKNTRYHKITDNPIKNMTDQSVYSELNAIQDIKKHIMKNINHNSHDQKFMSNFDLDYTSHKLLIQKIFDIILKKTQITRKIYFPVYLHDEIVCDSKIFLNIFDNYSVKTLITILETLHDDFLYSSSTLANDEILKRKSKYNMSNSGAAYTPPNLAAYIIKKTIEGYAYKNKNIHKVSLLDFGCGTGTFYFEALKIIHQNTKKKLEHIVLNNLYGIDYDPIAISILMIKICFLLKNYTSELLQKLSKKIILKNMLYVCDDHIPNTDNMEISYKHEFSEIFNNNNGFDIIVSNPPYKILKGTGIRRYQTHAEYVKEKQAISNEVNYFRNNKFYQISTTGMLNYYRLSIECMLKITNTKASIGLICPSTIFGDIGTSKLRNEIFDNHELHYAAFFPEKYNQFKQVMQAMTIMVMNKNTPTTVLHVDDFRNNTNIDVDVKTLKQSFRNYELPFITAIEWNILKKMKKVTKISNLPKIRNRRGEFDLSLLKKYIVKYKTNYPLIRGKNIINNLHVSEGNEYVKISEFLSQKSQDYISKDYNHIRIIGQQITNIDSNKRLKFAICNKNHIIANSCNYLTIDPSLNMIWILIQLNSHLINWRFKITSTNNHVNNYEIDELPLFCDPVSLKNIKTDIQKEVLVCKVFNLNMKETVWILKDHFKSNEIMRTYKKMCI